MYYFDLIKKLYENKIDYLVVGGLAVNLYGIPRVTQDLDIIIALNKENIYKTNEILKNLGYVPRLPVNPNDLAKEDIRQKWIKEKNLKAFSFYHQQENYKVVDIVLLTPVDFSKAYKNKEVKQAQGIDINLVSVDDLITMKKASGRQQDLSDVELLKKIKNIKRRNLS